MGKRKNKTAYSDPADEDFDEDAPGIITEADGTQRMLRPEEVERAVVGAELAAELATNVTLRQQMFPDDDEQMDTGHGARGQPTLLVPRLPRPCKEPKEPLLLCC